MRPSQSRSAKNLCFLIVSIPSTLPPSRLLGSGCRSALMMSMDTWAWRFFVNSVGKVSGDFKMDLKIS
eukprot:CAMPEP_0117587216 /NCGR_PEP_ID=MMETSP0784-20121206/69169_1 /TAXON_ID=39447 /ORGANISM="" /LENGTH=67 /DNA_ID=CAMNT_0005388433 /DNA_START=20 /DNA_END=220 /DNA_ORIENTATION=-